MLAGRFLPFLSPSHLQQGYNAKWWSRSYCLHPYPHASICQTWIMHWIGEDFGNALNSSSWAKPLVQRRTLWGVTPKSNRYPVAIQPAPEQRAFSGVGASIWLPSKALPVGKLGWNVWQRSIALLLMVPLGLGLARLQEAIKRAVLLLLHAGQHFTWPAGQCRWAGTFYQH